MFLEVLIASFIVMLASLGGALSFWKVIGKVIEKNLGLLISFSAGFFLFVSYELGKEAVLHSPNIESGLFWILVGMIFIWTLFKALPHSHEHHQENCNHKHPSIDIRKILTGNGIHNIGDGILIATTFSVDISLGIIATISVFIHEFVQETSIFFILRNAGYNIKKAITINFFVSGTILIGSLGGIVLLSTFEKLEAPLLGISAGAFLIVVLQDLIPHSLHESRKKNCLPFHLLFFVLGLLLMYSFSIIFPHSHEHDHEHHEHNHYNRDEHYHHKEGIENSTHNHDNYTITNY